MLFFYRCRQEGGKDSDGAEGEKMVRDLFIEGRRSGGDGGGASEFLIIATATSHLATGYTMAAVALATAWSLVGYMGRMMRRAGRETGRQME